MVQVKYNLFYLRGRKAGHFPQSKGCHNVWNTTVRSIYVFRELCLLGVLILLLFAAVVVLHHSHPTLFVASNFCNRFRPRCKCTLTFTIGCVSSSKKCMLITSR